MIHKHEIPILEFDDNPQAVLMPTHEGLDLHLSEKCIYAFLEDEIDRFAEAVGAKQVASFVSATKTYPVYVMEDQGEKICLAQAPVGSAAAAQFMDWLIGYGVKKIISAGSCGVLVDMEENAFLIPTKALRDEGASYHYVAPSRYIEVDGRALNAIETVLKQASIPYQEVMTWSTDGFYRETLTRWPIASKKGVVWWRWSVPHLQRWPSFVMQFGACSYLPQILLQTWKIMTNVTGAQKLLRRP